MKGPNLLDLPTEALAQIVEQIVLENEKRLNYRENIACVKANAKWLWPLTASCRTLRLLAIREMTAPGRALHLDVRTTVGSNTKWTHIDTLTVKRERSLPFGRIWQGLAIKPSVRRMVLVFRDWECGPRFQWLVDFVITVANDAFLRSAPIRSSPFTAIDLQSTRYTTNDIWIYLRLERHARCSRLFGMTKAGAREYNQDRQSPSAFIPFTGRSALFLSHLVELFAFARSLPVGVDSVIAAEALAEWIDQGSAWWFEPVNAAAIEAHPPCQAFLSRWFEFWLSRDAVGTLTCDDTKRWEPECIPVTP